MRASRAGEAREPERGLAPPKPRFPIVSVLVGGALLGAVGGARPARAVTFAISNTPIYTSGKFHSNVRTGILYDPTRIDIMSQRWGVSLTVPYLSITNLPNGANYAGGAVTAGGGTATHDASGLGDIRLGARVLVLRGKGRLPVVAPFVSVKFGSASSSNGLGTGLADYELGVMVAKPLGRFVPFVRLSYTFVGSDARYPLHDIVSYAIGCSYVVRAFPDRAPEDTIGLIYSGGQSELSIYPDPQTFILSWTHAINPTGTGIQVFGIKGVTNSSPDLGGGIGLRFVF